MSDLNTDKNDTYGDSHDWKSGQSHQWGIHGGHAQTPWTCQNCGIGFIHRYHDIANIRVAMRKNNIPDQCEESKKMILPSPAQIVKEKSLKNGYVELIDLHAMLGGLSDYYKRDSNADRIEGGMAVINFFATIFNFDLAKRDGSL